MLVVDFTAVKPEIENLTTQVDGVRVNFTTAFAFEEVLRVMRNGQYLTDGVEYTWTAPNTVTFTNPPKVHSIDGKDVIIVEII